jgi:hypothetical protein
MPIRDSIKLTEERIKIMAEAIKNGVPVKYAALKSGLCEQSYYNYLREAEKLYSALIKDDPEGNKELTDKEHILILFLESIKKARSEAIERNVTLINVAAKDSWQAAAWFLERTDHENFGRKYDHEVKINDLEETKQKLKDFFNKPDDKR